MTSEPRLFPCNTCSLTFTTSELQRSHMRQPWHISNLRRRVASEPALTEQEYITGNQIPEIVRQQKDKQRSPSPDADIEHVQEGESEKEKETSEDRTFHPTQCLFCNLNSTTTNANIDHMSSTHGLFIPSPDQLANMDSLLCYLGTIVFEYNECLYCGLEKGTVDGVQTHMRDKGHCMINTSANSELLDFWEASESEDDEAHLKTAATMLSETEMRLPSGAVINSRSDTTQLRARPGLTQSRTKSSQQRIKRNEMRAITALNSQENPDASRGNDRRVAVRSEMGLAGVPENQIRALQITEKKMIRREAIAKAAQRHAKEHIGTKANQGKYYKTEAPIYQAG